MSGSLHNAQTQATIAVIPSFQYYNIFINNSKTARHYENDTHYPLYSLEFS